MGDDDPSDAGLALGLGLHGWEPPRREKRQPPATRSSSPAPAADPSLTLALSDDACPLSIVQQSSPRSWSSMREKEPGSEEEEEGNAKKKLRLNKEQSALLEAMFKEHSTLNPTQKQALARKLNLRPRQVEVWFQNRRARTKLKQTEVDCEHLRNYCEWLADENRKLQRELHELKAHNTYVSTVSMCPSCERKSGGDLAQEGGAAAFLVRPKSHFCGPFATSHPPSAAC